jgi:hypothetical protein
MSLLQQHVDDDRLDQLIDEGMRYMSIVGIILKTSYSCDNPRLAIFE